MAVLRSLEQGPQSLGRVARAVTLSKPTVHRLLASLAHRQMVIQDPASGDYMLGPGSFGIADAVMRGAAGLGVLLGPALEHLRDVTGETAAVYVRAGLDRICIGQAVSLQPVRYAAHVGTAYPLHTGSMGKLLLAYSDGPERRDLLDHLRLRPVTKATIVDRARLEDELERIGRAGFATSRGERATGVASMSAPVFAADGRILAALSIIGPDTRLTEAAIARLRAPLVAAAHDVTRQVARRERARTVVGRRKVAAGVS